MKICLNILVGKRFVLLLFLYYGLTPSPISSFQSMVAADVYRSADIRSITEKVYYRNSKIRWNYIYPLLIKRRWPWTRTVDSHNFWKPLCFSCRLLERLWIFWRFKRLGKTSHRLKNSRRNQPRGNELAQLIFTSWELCSAAA